MLRKLSLLFSLCICLSLYGQNDEARQHLRQLKNSMLLVRLQTKSMSIEALEAQGRHKQAEALREKQYLENKEAVLSFRNNFDFCPVYFFYSSASDNIREGKFEGQLFNSHFQPLELAEKPDTFFTAEFGATPRMAIEGLIIMDQEMRPLDPPFPFFQRKHIFFSLVKLSKAKIIARLNHRLHETYQLWY